MMVFYLLRWNEICATFETVVMADVSHCGVDQPVDLTQIWIFFSFIIHHILVTVLFLDYPGIAQS